MKNQNKPLQESEFWEMCGGRVVPEDFEPPAGPEEPRRVNVSGFMAGVVTTVFLIAVAWVALCVAWRIFH